MSKGFYDITTKIKDFLTANGSLETQLYKINGDMVCNPFQDRFENLLAGWVLNLNIDIPNEQTIC